MPAGKTLVYNGKTQTGVASGENYTITGNTSAKAGSYTATAALKDKTLYTWADGTTADQKIKWTLSKAANPLTIKKNKKMKKGTYKVKVKVRAAGNSNYNASAKKTVTFKVKIK